MAADIKNLDESTFDETIGSSETPVLVDFWAERCGPCKMIAPILEEIATEEQGLSIAKVNVDESPDLARRYGIMSIPALILFQNGEPAKTMVGAKPKSALLEELGEFL
ncbi:MAG: thioredoxin [Actinobacteria bacterium]|nr:thioredoxin [Actinomycetota bacterium]